jgi:hypothetical protein
VRLAGGARFPLEAHSWLLPERGDYSCMQTKGRVDLGGTGRGCWVRLGNGGQAGTWSGAATS